MCHRVFLHKCDKFDDLPCMWVGNVFAVSVCLSKCLDVCVCLSLCLPVWATTFEQVDLETSFLAWWYNLMTFSLF